MNNAELVILAEATNLRVELRVLRAWKLGRKEPAELGTDF